MNLRKKVFKFLVSFFLYLCKPKEAMLTKEGKKIVRAELRKYFGHADLNKVRKFLKGNAINKYGCEFTDLTFGNGVSICYTSNPNHFASFYVKLQKVGMVHTLALTKKDITKAGKMRGCGNYFAL